MKNHTLNASLLEFAGYTETQIDRYFKLFNRKSQHGLQALTVSDRRFYLKAQADMKSADGLLEKELVAARTRAISGRNPVETKLHYRWVESALESAKLVVDLLPGEVSAYVIFLEEVLAALVKYQPVLDQVDTTKRRAFNPLEHEILTLAASFGRVAPFNVGAHMEHLKGEFEQHWSSRWEERGAETPFGAVIPLSDADDFRAEVRAQVECLTRNVYPSVAVTVG